MFTVWGKKGPATLKFRATKNYKEVLRDLGALFTLYTPWFFKVFPCARKKRVFYIITHVGTPCQEKFFIPLQKNNVGASL